MLALGLASLVGCLDRARSGSGGESEATPEDDVGGAAGEVEGGSDEGADRESETADAESGSTDEDEPADDADADGEESTGGEEPADKGDSADGGRPHPAIRGVETRPVLGDRSAGATIVEFSDPSCPACRKFHLETFPRIREELIESGEAAHSLRVVGVLSGWGVPAAHALVATHERDEDAFWALTDHYYDEQSAFDEENVYDRTGAFLAERTDVDASAVVEDARDRRHRGALRENREALEATDAPPATPIFVLFEEGEYRTTIVGHQNYEVFAGALGH